MNLKAILCLAASLCVLAPAELQAKNFRWTSKSDATTLDPHGNDEGFTNAINMLVYERLIQPGKDMSLTPWLATSWKSVSPTKRVVSLRKGVKFHDGSDLTAADVIASIERVRNASIASPMLDRARELYGETLALGHERIDMSGVVQAIEGRTSAIRDETG